MEKKWHLICSCSSSRGLSEIEEMINAFWYSSDGNYKVTEDFVIHDTAGKRTMDNYRVIEKNGRYRFEGSSD